MARVTATAAVSLPVAVAVVPALVAVVLAVLPRYVHLFSTVL